MDLNGFLIWLGTSAGSGIAASFILERIAAFQTLTSDAKMWVSFGTMSGIGVLSFLTLTYVPAETLQVIAPYFMIIATAFTSIFSGTLFHKTDDGHGSLG